jgi:hypothetical protein
MKTFIRTLKSGVTVEYVDAFWKILLQDDDILSTRLGDGTMTAIFTQWAKLPQGVPKSAYTGNECTKHSWCAHIKTTLDKRCPLFLRVAPAVRDVLWPTREEWDGLF